MVLEDRRAPQITMQLMIRGAGGYFDPPDRGPTGRLFVHLREEKGYTYGAYSNLGALAYRGAWQASTQVRTEVTKPALTDLLDEIRQIREVRVPDKEFLDNKRSIVAGFALELESAVSVLSNHIIRYRYGMPADYWDRYPERIMAVTQDEILAAGKKYLDPSRLGCEVEGRESQSSNSQMLQSSNPHILRSSDLHITSLWHNTRH